MPTFVDLRCLICDARRHRRIFTKGGRDFIKCDKCNLTRLHPIPSLDELEDYYEGMQRRGSPLAAEEEMARVTARTRLSKVLQYTRGGHWLDVGCHNGIFLEEVLKAGFDAEGIDISKTAVEKARSRSIKAYATPVEKFLTDTRFDAVTLFDVIEHVPDPISVLRSVRKLLKPGGTLALTTPDTNSVTCIAMRRHWYFYLPEQHIFYFDRKNLVRMLKGQGFDVLGIFRATKALNYNYALGQFGAYNPLIYRLWKGLGFGIPSSWRRRPFSLYIGEMMIVARKQDDSGLRNAP